MNILSISLAGLRRRKAKAVFIVAGLMAAVAAMSALMGLSGALKEEISGKLEKYGANIIITPYSESLSLAYEGVNLGGFSFETREIDQTALKAIRTIENSANLAAVGPVVLGAVEAGPSKVLLAGIDFSQAHILKPWWSLKKGAPEVDQLVVGSEAARVLGLKPGGVIFIRGRKMAVREVLETTGTQDDSLLFTGFGQAQEILGKKGKISMMEVAALCKDCPVDEMVAQISEKAPGARVTAIQSVVKGRMASLHMFESFSLGVSMLVALVGGLVVLATMMGSVRERTTEIGIFRAIGFRKSRIVAMILFEAGLLSTAAGVLGYGLGLAIAWIALPYFSQGEALISPDPWLALSCLGLALACGLSASIYPALAASRLDPAKALRTL